MPVKRVPPSAAATYSDGGGPAADDEEAAARLQRGARALGFGPVGIAPPTLPPEERERLLEWVRAERHGTMGYMAQRPEARASAATLLEGAGAVLMVALPCAPRTDLPEVAAGVGVVATYAQPYHDYHRVLAGRIEALARFYRDELIPGGRAQRFCDTSPLLERAFAVQAGLGFFGKNTNVIDPASGSYFFLGGLVVDRPLPADGPDPTASCGTCTRCLDACPTDAFPAPYVLDARRCISYLTIEHRGAYAAELREGVGAHIFGCDVCQTVCPWNTKFAPDADPELAPDDARRDPLIVGLARVALTRFKSVARGTPWERAGKRGFLRNLATALGNTGDAADGEQRALLAELAEHEDPAVSEHARWARDRLGSGEGAGSAG